MDIQDIIARYEEAIEISPPEVIAELGDLLDQEAERQGYRDVGRLLVLHGAAQAAIREQENSDGDEEGTQAGGP